MTKISYAEARESFGALLDQVTREREIVIIERQGREDVALIAADDLNSLRQTVHLLRSPANATRLSIALYRGQTERLRPMKLESLRAITGLAE